MPASGSSMAVAAFNRMTLLTNSPNSRSRKRHSVTLISPLLSLLKGREADWTDFQLPFHCANNGCTSLSLSLSLSLQRCHPPRFSACTSTKIRVRPFSSSMKFVQMFS